MNDTIAKEVAQVLGMEAVRAADKLWVTLKDGFFTGIIFVPPACQEQRS